MKVIKENYIPLVMTIHGIYKDAEGQFWQSIKDQTTYRTGNRHAVTPSGKVLCENEPRGSVAANCDPIKALERWKALPEADRRPGAVKVEELTEMDARFPKRPAGSLILKGFNRPLERGPNGEIQRMKEYWDCQELSAESMNWAKFKDPEPGRTWVWLTREQWTPLVPTDPKEGTTFAVPDATADRLVRLPLLNTLY